MHWNARPYEWVGDWSARRASLTPDREALVDATSGERYTYAELDARANRTARLLAEYGVEKDDSDGATGSSDDAAAETGDPAGPGERVAVVSRNRVEVFDLFFATGKTGGVLAPLSHRLAPRELGELLELVEPRLLVVEAPFTGRVADALADASVDPPVLQLPAADRGSGQDGAEVGNGEAGDGASDSEETADASTDDATDGDSPPLGADPYHDALPDASRASEAPVDTASVALDDVHLLLHTGGSTGTPKETEITHGTIAWNSLNTIASWGLRPDDVTPLVFPTFHTGGWNVITVPLVHLGGTVVIDREVDAGRVLEQIETERATVLVAVPAVLRTMATHDDWDETDCSSLRFVKSGGGPARASVVESWRDRGIDVSQGYGLTECGPNDFAMPDDWPDEKVASVGKPALHVDARVVGDDGEVLSDGEVGELELAGQHAAAGYWRNEAETEATFGTNSDGEARGTGDARRTGGEADGRPWVSTGDLVRVDEDGYYHVVGRKKTMFVSGGENVYPPVVEDEIAAHPAVEDVIVVGVPDEQWGTVGKAVIEPAADGDADDLTGDAPLTLGELETFLEDRLARYEIPASIAFVDELPTSGPSKIDRQAVEDRFGGDGAA